MFSIYDGRRCFWQWDTGRRLVVNGDCDQVHYCGAEETLMCPVYKEDGVCVADVPDVLLQEAQPILVYAYASDPAGKMTVVAEWFDVKTRPKPSDYVYTQAEIWTAEKAVADALEAAKASGDFKGDKGEKGDPGAVKFAFASYLPAEGEGNTIYLVPRVSAVATMALESDGYTLKGVWVFNEKVSFGAESGEYYPWNEALSFTSNGEEFTGIVCVANPVDYVRTNGSYCGGYDGVSWINAAYRIVDFGDTEQEVDASFYAWFTANAVASGETDTDTDAPADNLFDEYIFVEGMWEKLGSATVAVQLDEYVKKADMDALVKESVAANEEILADEEKTAACAWLGACRATANEDGTLALTLADGSRYIVNATKEDT